MSIFMRRFTTGAAFVTWVMLGLGAFDVIELSMRLLAVGGMWGSLAMILRKED